MKAFLLFFLTVFLASNVFAGSIAGKVIDKKTGEPLVGANVYLKGTTIGAPTDENGMYYFKVDDGHYTLVCDFVGYAVEEVPIDVKGDVRHDFALTEFLFSKTIEVIAERAQERMTPVAFTNIDDQVMEARLGSRDIPLVLNTTPSVYSTQQGGGAGDARINVRGFNQRNVAIMINGVPVNDMENGWVYWSNWDGVGDATASIQLQRGLSAVNLATPSIGGTVNIITSPTKTKSGLMFKQEYGSGTFLKTTFMFNTGLLKNKFAFNGAIVRKTGDGIIDKTWTDAWAYYFGASYNINEKNRVELYALGAPQRHGQNLYKQNIAVYSKKFAKDLGYSKDALDHFEYHGRTFNQNWGPVDPSYKGKQAVGDKTFDRYSPNFINERENFYHKPQVNLNFYSQLKDNMTFTNVLYYSGGHGGGTGTYGQFMPDFSHTPWIWNWDKIVDYNSNGTDWVYKIKDANGTTKDTMKVAAGQSKSILRNSRNNQWTIGNIAKLNWKVNENLTTTFGIDWRTAEIEHYREVRDLLGGTFFSTRDLNGNKIIKEIKNGDTTYYFNESDFWKGDDFKRKLGDKIDYYFTNTVDWLGGFVQAEYTKDKWTAYTTLGFSTIKYSHTNHFRKAADGKELKLESDHINGYQIKGGGMYRIAQNGEIYANFGYIQKVPIFDQVIDDRHGVFAGNPENEKFISFEVGSNWRLLNNQLTLKANIYNTLWKDRALPQGIQTSPGVYDILFITGLNQLHQGVEFEAAYQPMPLFRFDLAGSVGNWKIMDDVTGQYREVDSETGSLKTTKYQVALKGLKIGDAPQTQIALAGSVFPIKGLSGQLVMRYYANYYANWDPTSRLVTDNQEPDRGQSWKLPSYYLLDFHGSYTLPFHLSGVKFKVFAHVFNILDTKYISDATDNSKYNAYKDDGKNHKADDAEVFFGLPRYFNVGISVYY